MKKAKKVRLVLAEGETTGHAHVVEGVRELEGVDGDKRFEVDAPVTVRHEEHKPITVPPGTYRSGQVMEQDHAAEEARRVQD